MVNPQLYNLTNDISIFHVSYLINEYAEELLNISGKCMDIGCGPGDVTHNILLPAVNRNMVIMGTDISANMIEFAKEMHKNEKRLTFEVLDIQTKNLPKKYVSEFNHIFSFHALHWCDDIRQAFENIYCMLQPGGTILTFFVTSHDIYDVILTLMKDIRYAPYMQGAEKFVSPYHKAHEPHHEMKKMLKSIGFEICHISHRDLTYLDKNSENFISMIMSVIPFTTEMPPILMEEFQKDMACEYAKKSFGRKQLCDGVEENIVLELHKLLILYARKPM